MQHLFQHTDKNAISQLPLYKFSGRIIVIQGQFEAQRAVSALMKETLLGIDTETRPSFRKGRENKVALLQVATQDVCYLFRLNSLGFNESLVQLLQAESITKIGLSLKDDILRLRKMQDFTPCSFLDLQDYVKKFGIEDFTDKFMNDCLSELEYNSKQECINSPYALAKLRKSCKDAILSFRQKKNTEINISKLYDTIELKIIMNKKKIGKCMQNYV